MSVSQISLEVMHTIGEGQTALVEGDIIAVYDRSKTALSRKSKRPIQDVTSIDMPRTGLIHVDDFPATFVEARQLSSSTYHAPTEAEDPHSGGIKYASSWCALLNTMPQELQDEFDLKRETTASWAQAAAFIWSKNDGQLIADVIASKGKKWRTRSNM